jgi:hypothetical protein
LAFTAGSIWTLSSNFGYRTKGFSTIANESSVFHFGIFEANSAALSEQRTKSCADDTCPLRDQFDLKQKFGALPAQKALRRMILALIRTK